MTVFKCLICNKKFPLNTKGRHLSSIHNISSKEYYDKYLKKPGDGICPICGKNTTWNKWGSFYSKYCCHSCAHAGSEKQRRETNIRRYNCPSVFENPKIRNKILKTFNKKFGGNSPACSKKIKNKIKSTNLKRYGVVCTLQNKRIAKKVKSTLMKHFGVDNPLKSKLIKKKASQTYFKKTGYYNPSQNPEVQYKKEVTSLKNNGTRSPFQNKEIRKKASQTYFKKTGYYNPSQNPEVHAKVFSKKKKPKSELFFRKLLKKENLEFEKEYYILKENVWQHNFDFAIFKNNKLKCLIEIDGEFYHGLLADCDGYHSLGNNDYLRWKLVPKNVKFLVIDSQRLEEGFKELKRILPMKYKDWKKEMLRSIPKNIEEAIPKFSKKRMLYDWKRLKTIPYYKHSYIGKSILLNFCRSHWKEFDWKSIRKTLYKSPVSSYHLLEGLDHFKNVVQLREKFRKKYRSVKEVIVKKHSPEKMLAICSLGKTYISKEVIDKESIQIIKFLKLDAYCIKKGLVEVS